MKIAIVGLGLIGGSLAKDLRSQINVHVIGVDSNESHRLLAISLGLVDEVMELSAAVEKADMIILATPVNIIESLLPKILDEISNDTIVTDVGSTKVDICRSVKNHKNRSRYVASHPLAGTEFSGPEAAIKGLFVGAKNIIVDEELSDKEAVKVTQKVYESVGMKTFFLKAEEHDRHLAYVSHLSHVTSFALGLTVLNIEKDEKQIFNLASTGFSSTARLAKSSPDTWSAIFRKNDRYLIEAIDGYIKHLNEFKTAIEKQDKTSLNSLMKEANQIKKILNH